MLYLRQGKVQAIQQNKSKLGHDGVKLRRNSFHWSVEPLSRWMCFLGISIPFPSEVSSCSFARLLHTTFCFLLMTSSHLYLVFYTIHNAKSISAAYVNGNSTSTLAWNFVIENIALALYTIGSNISFLICIRSGAWSDFVNLLTLLDQNLATSYIYPSSRKFAIKTLIFIISSMLCVETLLLLDSITNDSTLTRKILEGYCIFTKIYPATQLALFCVLTRTLSLQTEAIRKHVEDMCTRSLPASLTITETRNSELRILRRHHRLVCNSIHKLNYCFGTFLALEVVHVFIIFTICSLYTLMGAISGDLILEVLNVIVCLDCIVHLYFLTYYSDDIASQIDKTYEALADLLYQQPSLQNEVMLFSEQLSQMKSNINAMGFFDVRKQLFPSLIGTTLTYFLILLQFQSAEKTGK
ncbi:hypothetical protein GHT06_010215 [Daphnia sinensis]|uniref:Gustatory receptor n=1 Tax=Daphnia sinensis TaxID=1820382 RepID=A0AAD5KY22_9CRUS|nr:hypothetical protein GHT06_010215 [Daphnia sinensis]